MQRTVYKTQNTDCRRTVKKLKGYSQFFYIDYVLGGLFRLKSAVLSF